MAQCIVLNISDSDDWRHQLPEYARPPGVYIPKEWRSGLIHPDRESAEKEAARLACQHAGRFAVFELVSSLQGRVLEDTELVRGLGACGAVVPRWHEQPLEI